MTERRFSSWTRETISGFVEQQVGAGAMPERQAREYAEHQFDSLLTQGMFTAGHHVWSAYEGDTEIGYLWLGVRQRPDLVEGYVYDVAVAPRLRSRGYGRALMVAGEGMAGELGVSTMLLNVFGHNAAARRLYESLGYSVAVTHVLRHLDTNAPLPSAGNPALRLEPRSEERFAAFDGDTEVGALTLSVTTRPDGRHAFGRDLAVDEQWQGRGYGRAIMVAAEQLCRDRAVASIGFDLDGPDDAAPSSYERMGFTVVARLLRKDLFHPENGLSNPDKHRR